VNAAPQFRHEPITALGHAEGIGNPTHVRPHVVESVGMQQYDSRATVHPGAHGFLNVLKLTAQTSQ
jgi:hypothetical protein